MELDLQTLYYINIFNTLTSTGRQSVCNVGQINSEFESEDRFFFTLQNKHSFIRQQLVSIPDVTCGLTRFMGCHLRSEKCSTKECHFTHNRNILHTICSWFLPSLHGMCRTVVFIYCEGLGHLFLLLQCQHFLPCKPGQKRLGVRKKPSRGQPCQ